MAVAKKQNRKTEKVEIMVEPEWLAMVRRVAEDRGYTLSSYIRQAVKEKIRRDEGETIEGQQGEEGGEQA